MAASNDTIPTPLERENQAANYRQTIIVGNVSTAAWRYMVSRGAIVEERDELIYITLPPSADVGKWNDSHDWRVVHWCVSFEGEGDVLATAGTMHIVIESELYPFESRCYAVPI